MKFDSILENARARGTIGFALSLLFHLSLLLFVLEHRSTPVQETGDSPTAPLSVRLIPPSDDAQQQSPSSAITVSRAQPKRAGHPKETARKDQSVARRKAAPAKINNTAVARVPSPAPEPAPAPAAQKSADAPTDMMDMLTAARDRRRAAGVPDANDTDSEPKPETDDNAIARANVAHSLQAHTRGDNDGGGVFQVTFKGVRTAEMIFRGWDARRRNTTRQMLEIDAGLNGDVDLAIVRKMIEVIRREKTGDFDWESRRLGRVVRLSARIKDNAELEDFLKKDFFDAYR